MQQLFVLFHSPGPAWDHGLAFLEQRGIEDHIAFMRSLTDAGRMVLGGPFADGETTLAVRMAVIRAADLTEAQRFACEDRSVERGLLRVAVRAWQVPMGFALKTIPPAGAG